ncbi:MAG: saccharopine dehydrogenase NADP-binding domain-containing protein [Saprospiraceae bacterium]|nr:saccharopine dehydrogenase NADP-binding domain-containing protein [Saprospiraceae bacterium]
MKNVLIIGAGRSATSLIHYLLNNAESCDWNITVADMSLELAMEKVNGHSRGKAVTFNALDADERKPFLENADIVVSMLPAHLHIHVAKDCLELGKDLATASYVSPELKKMHDAVKAKGLIFLNEIGLDPGIDHMSAMQMINSIRAKGGKINAFYSYAGGLVAPESDNNPWHYKFSWNPRNVVLAGQGVSQYLYEHRYRHTPYHRLFSRSDMVYVPSMGWYDAYPNRTSLKYKGSYGLDDIPTIMRGTLRYKGFCKAWDLLVRLGLTDDSYTMTYADDLTYRQWLRSYLPPNLERIGHSTLRAQIATLFNLNLADESLDKLEWLGLFSDEKIPIDDATSAQILQELLERKWKLEPDDKDMILMQHEVEYEIGSQKKRHLSTLIHKGENSTNTAMAQLVGLPLAIGVKHILLGNFNSKGVLIPITPDIYEPVMAELGEMGIGFKEKDIVLESFNEYFSEAM